MTITKRAAKYGLIRLPVDNLPRRTSQIKASSHTFSPSVTILFPDVYKYTLQEF